MRAGRRDRRLRIDRLIVTQDSAGAEMQAWAELTEVWAEKLPMGGREFIAAQQIVAECSEVFTILYRAGLDETMRVVCDGVTYNIRNIGEIGRRRGLKLICTHFDEN